MELRKEDFPIWYVRIIKAAGLMWYLPESVYDEPKDVANKPLVLVKRNDAPQYAKASKKRRVCAGGLLL